MRSLLLPACSILLIGALSSSACTGSSGPREERRVVEDARPKEVVDATNARAIGDVRVIHRLDWSGSWDQFLFGVDPSALRAHVRLSAEQGGARFALDTIDLATGERVERWSAQPDRAARFVGRYPRFETLSGDFDADLRRYASIVRASGPWAHRETAPPLAVSASPDGKWSIHAVPPDDGQDGDWLMLTNLETGARRRFDEGVRASYVAKFSPDSSAVAWIGGSKEFARPGRQVGYVLRVAALEGSSRAVAKVRGVIRAPMWSPDGKHVWAMGEGADRRERCLYRVDVPSFEVSRLACHPGDVDVVMSADATRVMLLGQPSSGPSQRLVWLDPMSGDVLATHNVERIHGVGEFGVVLSPERVLLYANGGQTLVIYDPIAGAEVQRIELGEQPVLGRHATQVAGDELILLRRASDGVDVIGVKVR